MGRVINKHGIYPSQEKTKCIKNALTPKNLTRFKA